MDLKTKVEISLDEESKKLLKELIKTLKQFKEECNLNLPSLSAEELRIPSTLHEQDFDNTPRKK